MNKVVFVALLIGLNSCSEKKAETKIDLKPKIDNTKQTAQIEFETEMHDFEKLKSGEILSYSFVFINKGGTELVINGADVDCGCIETNVLNEKVNPGEKGIVEVKFYSAGLFGKQLKTVEIQSNSKEPKHLIIFAEVENEQIEIGN